MAHVIESDNDLENDQLMEFHGTKSMLIFEVICVPAKTAKISTPRKFPCLQYVPGLRLTEWNEIQCVSIAT